MPDVSVAVIVKGTSRLERFQKAHPWVLTTEAPAPRALATACMSEHEDDVSQCCRASAASKEQPARAIRKPTVLTARWLRCLRKMA